MRNCPKCQKGRFTALPDLEVYSITLLLLVVAFVKEHGVRIS